MIRLFFIIILVTAFLLPVSYILADNQLNPALNYLQAHYNEQAAANQDWAAIGLGESGVKATVSGSDSSSLLSLERNVLARAAQGVGRTNEVNQIKASFHNDQFGDPNLINDDIFGVLAVASTDSAWLNSHAGVLTTIANTQRPDGSFGFSRSVQGDVDMTAAAIWALALESNARQSALNSARAFLSLSQNSDGGLGFRPGQVSNIASSSWAMIALTTLGQDTSAVRSYLLNQENPGGNWQEGSSANYLDTAYAVMALSGKKLPYIKPALATSPEVTNNPADNSSALAATNNAPGSAAPADRSAPLAANPASTVSNQPTAVKKVVRRQAKKIIVTTTRRELVCSASASASASVNGDGATASATASVICQ